jgi:hypothetical protein
MDPNRIIKNINSQSQDKGNQERRDCLYLHRKEDDKHQVQEAERDTKKDKVLEYQHLRQKIQDTCDCQ